MQSYSTDASKTELQQPQLHADGARRDQRSPRVLVRYHFVQSSMTSCRELTLNCVWHNASTSYKAHGWILLSEAVISLISFFFKKRTRRCRVIEMRERKRSNIGRQWWYLSVYKNRASIYGPSTLFLTQEIDIPACDEWTSVPPCSGHKLSQDSLLVTTAGRSHR